jgi:hypothetical protein
MSDQPWFRAEARRCGIKLRYVLPALLIGSSLVTGGWAQRKSTAKRTSSAALNMQSQGQGALSVAFTAAPDGAALTGGTSGQRVLNLGTVSYSSSPRTANVQMRSLEGRFIVSTKFGLSIQDPSQRCSSAAVLVSMAHPEPWFTLRLDGMKLGTTPQVIQGQVRLGTTFQHRLEIEVPTTLTEKNSQLQNAIIFQVIPN